MTKLFALIMICGCLFSCTTSYQQNNSVKSAEMGMPMASGKCFAKCLIQDQYEERQESFPIYSNIENVDHTIERIVLKPGTTKWVKKKVDKNCLSVDPNDCLVWCLTEVGAVKKEIKVPVHPATAGEVSYETYEIKKLIQKGGTTEWFEVVCADDISEDLVSKIQYALLHEGHQINEEEYNIFGKETKAAFVQYQRENGLPVGQMDFETLKALGISVDSL